jgi:3-deoxy-D-manno-octulosonic acid kinase
MLHYLHHGYRLGSRRQLTDSQLDRMIELFRTPPLGENRPLGGRLSICRVHLEDVGPVVVKHYRRGGLIGNLITQYYLKVAKTRGQVEFEQMEHVRTMGVRAPEPVAFAHRGLLIYRAWLVTREVPHAQTMVAFSRKATDRIAGVMAKLEQQIGILVDNRVAHADFHPGNILVDSGERVYIIDFDKCVSWRGPREKLARRYRARWCRAVEKHGLPASLCTHVQSSAP